MIDGLLFGKRSAVDVKFDRVLDTIASRCKLNSPLPCAVQALLKLC
jgi:hypothetical protein